MGRLLIKREKSSVGMAVRMNCYIDNVVVGKLKNGEEMIYDAGDGIIEFKCNLTGNPMSDVFRIDMAGKDFIQISAKQGAWKPKVTISENGTASLVETERASISKKSVFTPSKVVGGYFGINEATREWAVGKGFIPSMKNAAVYSYDDIIDFELIEDGTSVTKGGLGRAAVGGLVFGGVGAIVGGVTGGKKANQKCTSLMVKITVKNTSAPVEYIKLISSVVDKKSIAYKGAFQNAQEIISLLQLICNQRDEEKSMGASVTSSTQETSAADEIRKFKALLDDNIITEEEFLAKKRQLLGL